MIGTFANAAAVLLGGLIGSLLHKRFPEKIQRIVFQALGLASLLIGIQMALKGRDILLIVLSLLIGAVLGSWLDLEGKIGQFGDYLKGKVRSRSDHFTEGFVSASILFCVGAMAIVGSIEEGLRGDSSILFTKAMLDGFAAMAIASTYGIGVLFSALSVLLYQGGLTLFASILQPYATPVLIDQLSGVGGILIMGIGFRLLEIKKIPLADLLPSIAVLVLLTVLF